MSARGKIAFEIALTLYLLAAPSAFAQPPDLTYHTVAPCTVVDTRVAGGVFASNETRTYNVVGSGSFASQGGSSTGCGVPGFSNGIAQVQAVALVITSVSPASQGYIAANAADQSMAGSVVTFNAGDLPTNTGQVAVAQTSGVGDIKVLVAFSSSSHVVIRVVGYYSKDVQTVHVHPVPGDHTASGTRLLNALSGITNASATKRYVIKVEPGIYDLGSTMLEMKPYVDIEGTGQEATVIQGNGNDESMMTATVEGADFAELRDLQVKSMGVAGNSFAVGIALDEDDTTIRNVTVVSGGAVTNWGIRISQSSPVIEETTIEAIGASTVYGLVTVLDSHPVIRRTIISVSGTGTSGDTNGIFTSDNGCPSELSDVKIDVSGGGTAYGLLEHQFTTPCTIEIQGTSISASAGSAYGIYTRLVSIDFLNSKAMAAGSTSYGIYSAGFANVLVKGSEIAGATATVAAVNANIAGTMLDGGAASAAACAGVYDESYIFYASTCP